MVFRMFFEFPHCWSLSEIYILALYQIDVTSAVDKYDKVRPDIPNKLLISFKKTPKIVHLVQLESLLLLHYFKSILSTKYSNDIIKIEKSGNTSVGTITLPNEYPLQDVTANHLVVLIDFVEQLNKAGGFRLSTVRINESVGGFTLPSNLIDLFIISKLDVYYNGKPKIAKKYYFNALRDCKGTLSDFDKFLRDDNKLISILSFQDDIKPDDVKTLDNDDVKTLDNDDITPKDEIGEKFNLKIMIADYIQMVKDVYAVQVQPYSAVVKALNKKAPLMSAYHAYGESAPGCDIIIRSLIKPNSVIKQSTHGDTLELKKYTQGGQILCYLLDNFKGKNLPDDAYFKIDFPKLSIEKDKELEDILFGILKKKSVLSYVHPSWFVFMNAFVFSLCCEYSNDLQLEISDTCLECLMIVFKLLLEFDEPVLQNFKYLQPHCILRGYVQILMMREAAGESNTYSLGRLSDYLSLLKDEQLDILVRYWCDKNNLVLKNVKYYLDQKIAQGFSELIALEYIGNPQILNTNNKWKDLLQVVMDKLNFHYNLLEDILKSNISSDTMKDVGVDIFENIVKLRVNVLNIKKKVATLQEQIHNGIRTNTDVTSATLDNWIEAQPSGLNTDNLSSLNLMDLFIDRLSICNFAVKMEIGAQIFYEIYEKEKTFDTSMYKCFQLWVEKNIPSK